MINSIFLGLKKFYELIPKDVNFANRLPALITMSELCIRAARLPFIIPLAPNPKSFNINPIILF